LNWGNKTTRFSLEKPGWVSWKPHHTLQNLSSFYIGLPPFMSYVWKIRAENIP
jgi:hypothetical protein